MVEASMKHPRWAKEAVLGKPAKERSRSERNRLVPLRFQQEGVDIWSGSRNRVARTPKGVM